MALLVGGNQGQGSLLFDDQNQKSALSQQALAQHLGTLQQPQQQQAQQGGSMPSMPSGLLNQFMGGGSAAGGASLAGGGSAGGVGFGLGQPLVSGGIGSASFAGGSGAAAGGSAAGGAAGGAGGLAAAGPWAALAAAIIGNETMARKAGRRSEDTGQYAMDLITGKVMEQDSDYYAGKVGGFGGEIMKVGGKLGNPEGVWDLFKGLF